MAKKYTILFIDDDPAILAALKRGLYAEDYRRLFTDSGKKALELLEKEPIHVVVSDMRMPGMDGLHLLRLVKEKYPKIVRIVLSGYTQLQQILTTINTAGVFKFITKPWMMDEELKVVLAEAILYYRLQEERDELELALKNQNLSYKNILRKLDSAVETAEKQALLTGEALHDAIDTLVAQHLEPAGAPGKNFTDLREDLPSSVCLRPVALSLLADLIRSLSAAAVGESVSRMASDLQMAFRKKLSAVQGIRQVDCPQIAADMPLQTRIDLLSALGQVCGQSALLLRPFKRVQVLMSQETNENSVTLSTTLLFPKVDKNDASMADATSKPSYERDMADHDAIMEVLNLVIDPVMHTLGGRFACRFSEESFLCKFALTVPSPAPPSS